LAEKAKKRPKKQKIAKNRYFLPLLVIFRRFSAAIPDQFPEIR
jgi:hypothetical protein